ncbi:Wadjet anti-phage system protein JetD domain-containing protein [Streptomyces decoyicus]|uniref:Wadjet anti-phage system protein JetD domain-containing protein n=1 Tax=Streptomyces decoyicus TaxID=249567 RepID=UPI003624F41E
MSDPTDNTTPPLSPGAARLNAAIEARTDRATVSRATVVEAFNAALPGLSGSSRARVSLATLLEELAQSGTVNLPTSPSKWDAGRPALPDWVRIPTTPRTPLPSTAPISWRPELQWAYHTRLTTAQTKDLRAINRWFRDTSNRPDAREPLPLRERSHEIFNDEKRLDTLISGALFAPERLRLEQLATYREPPPLTYRRLGNGGTVLVVENSDTYATLQYLLTPSPGPVGHIAFGSGRAFEASVATLKEVPAVRRILYYGDLDADGLAIPARASIAADHYGLPPVEPATSLYSLLLKRKPNAGERIERERAHLLTAWLPAELREPAHALLTSARRLAQEATNRNHLRAEDGWRC